MFNILISHCIHIFPDPNAIITCEEVCDESEEPVCGSDDITYKNLCYLHRATCHNPEKEIQLLSEGQCFSGTVQIKIPFCPLSQWHLNFKHSNHPTSGHTSLFFCFTDLICNRTNNEHLNNINI